MQLQVGMVVYVTAGKEMHSYYAVTRLEGSAVYLADGKHRKLEKPKRKNVKHIRTTERILQMEEMTNRSLYRTLQQLNAHEGGK